MSRWMRASQRKHLGQPTAGPPLSATCSTWCPRSSPPHALPFQPAPTHPPARWLPVPDCTPQRAGALPGAACGWGRTRCRGRRGTRTRRRMENRERNRRVPSFREKRHMLQSGDDGWLAILKRPKHCHLARQPAHRCS